MDNLHIKKFYSAPKLLVAICVGLLLVNVFVLIINFQITGVLRLLIACFLMYKVLTGSKAASYILALLVFAASIMALYPLYFTYQMYFKTSSGGIDPSSDFPSVFYLKALSFAIPSILLFASSVYILISAKVKSFYEHQV